MAGGRIPGPLNTYAGLGTEVRPLGASPSASFCQPGPMQGRGLTRQQQELALDIAQITLDIVGIFEPTPFADGTNALISLGRGDWLGAGLSGISIIPYIGDLAKAGKLPGYSRKISDAIQLARHNAEFAKYLKPVLERLKKIIDTIPVDLSPDLANMVNKIKRPLDDYLGGAKWARHLSLTERLVIARMGSVQYVGDMVWKNIEIAKDYFLRHGVSEKEMIDALNGMDVHSPIEVVELAKGDKLVTSMLLPPAKRVADLNASELQALVPGQWFVKSGGGVGKESVGLAHGARQSVHFEVQQPVSILRSKAASVDDFWTDGMQTSAGHPGLTSGPGTKRKPWTQLEYDTQAQQLKVRPAVDEKGVTRRTAQGQLPTSLGIGTRGGGVQYYIPKSAQSSHGRVIQAVVPANRPGM